MAKTTSKSQQGYYSTYKANSRWKTNRTRKLTKLLKQHPNDKCLQEAVKDVKYRRKKPLGTGSWSKTNIKIAKLFKQFTGTANHDLFSSNPKVQSVALALRGSRQYKEPEGKVSFTLGARAHDKWGTLTWA